ncbi:MULTISPECIES: ADP-ribosylglycohydrolase family protein [unclassified Lysobacter]|uniref:ADP-ribosylglycohydrolase family protein n=1 Tax=unclassified Lysobacter TaxID=2635362 RepID=UPI001BE73F95|nr:MULTISPECIES: ADP-ribosylglycohydrolase family protein [unclassified Lysobacter]MBT2748458.1 ADP-ribosylglycohydrolase family protein [Lysobacter sp. ISL-42]MBT2752612.1 ADP-ribosylglycohydrolase family protein [Lysobacter sp. ISL-50]MBT2776659.1 ADP-ribosylglycohydrolase family protein [Lysobacter sp. ISL-54]MBT2782530.1 ADP-ribosylglycohydrolase family protein [Lysobacter sp. ISL-52]
MNALQRARLALDGLSIGDAFGQCFFQNPATAQAWLEQRELPPAPWHYTDDTQMSLSVVVVLAADGQIDQERLALSLARNYEYDRAYGPSMHRVLERIANGESWREVAGSSFGGQGSHGNGAAMRAAPVGAYFSDDLTAVAEQAHLSAEVTHRHPEGITGAVAVALAAAQACRFRRLGQRPPHAQFIAAIAELLPISEVRSKLLRAQAMDHVTSLDQAVAVLGNGSEMSAQDTVPYAIWCCAQALEDYPSALWLAVSAGGDRDTLCAIVGGVVACYVGDKGIPASWRERRESLPDWPDAPSFTN